MNIVGKEPEERQDLQNKMACGDKGYLIVARDGLELWQFPDDGAAAFTGLVFDSVPDAYDYVFPWESGFTFWMQDEVSPGRFRVFRPEACPPPLPVARGMQRIFSVLVACAVCMLLTTRRGDASIASQAEDVFRSIGEGFEDGVHDFEKDFFGSHVDVSIGERYIVMPTYVDEGKVTFKVTNMGSEDLGIQIYGGGLYRSLAATLVPGETAKLTAYLEPGLCSVIASAQSGPTKRLTTEFTVRPSF